MFARVCQGSLLPVPCSERGREGEDPGNEVADYAFIIIMMIRITIISIIIHSKYLPVLIG